MKKVSIVIPVYNQLKMTINCLRDILNTCEVEIEIIVVDDGSQEPIKYAINKMFPQIKVLKNEVNKGFAKTINKGIREASGNYIMLLNNDIRIKNPLWLKIMLDTMDKHNLDMTAPAGGRLDNNWNYLPGEAKKMGEKFSYLVGWALLLKKEVFNTIGLVPEQMGKGYWEDVLLGHRAKKAGFKADITENTGIEHLYHKTFVAEGYNLAKEYEEKRKIFLEIISKEGLDARN